MRMLHVAMLMAALSGLAMLAPANAMSINAPKDGMQLQSADPAQPKAAPAPQEKATTKKKKAPDKTSEHRFIEGYKQAYDLVYNRQEYAQAIVTLRALGRDEHPDVANLIGFSSRKLGRTEDAKTWYEKALAADPQHARTWQYYGMWHLEMGDRQKAEEHLKTIQAICGSDCEEFTSLKLALSGESLIY